MAQGGGDLGDSGGMGEKGLTGGDGFPYKPRKEMSIRHGLT